MKILVLNGSPRPKGHTAQMLQAFRSGSQSAGHEVWQIDVCRKNIHGCLGCEYCHTKGGGACIQQDDMQEIYPLLHTADMLVLASPIYYHNLSGQLKCTIDRFYASGFPEDLANLKKIAMFLSSGDPDMYDGALFSLHGDFEDFLGLENAGVFTHHGEQPVSAERLQEIAAFAESLPLTI